MATSELPVLIVGDVHGDIERLFQALAPYPDTDWHTVFVGDLVDHGMFGVGALRYARDRKHSTVLLGNHEVAMLWALRDPSRLGFWMSIGGQRHDLDELARDPGLQEWIKQRPAMLRLPDGTLAQHCGHDLYANLIDGGDNLIGAINAAVADLIQSRGEAELWDVLSAKNIFATQPERLHNWLQATGCRRVVFGHTPHNSNSRPETYHEGRAINFDGGFSRSHRKYRRQSPIAASVAPLDSLQ